MDDETYKGCVEFAVWQRRALTMKRAGNLGERVM
jgi:hypothetical protein